MKQKTENKEKYNYIKEYERWLKNASEFRDELISMSDEQIEDAFCRSLEFGTGGIRGIMGAGTNRMNIYTVAKTTQGLAEYILEKGGSSAAVSFDSRNNSELFSRTAAEVFAANGIKTYIFSELMPTPCLSFAVRYYGCFSGVMVTASHNPSEYNGYKVYGSDGGQLTEKAASETLNKTDRVNIFSDIKRMDFREGIRQGIIEYISPDCVTAYIEEVKNRSVLYGDKISRDMAVVYSPLNGTGLKPVLRALGEGGYENISVVPEQEKPDGDFPTCPRPNPEIKEAMECGIRYADEKNADLLLATDPDCDRIGIAVRDGEEFRLLTGNEIGILLFDYICSQRIKHGMMPDDAVAVKTIVTTKMIDALAETYNVDVRDVLTGFKYIGEQIGNLEKDDEEKRYIFGFEESYGYLSGTYVRDKDAVNAAYLICEMFAYYKSRGTGLYEKLQSLYHEYGYYMNKTVSFDFKGLEGFAEMQKIMSELRENPKIFASEDIKEIKDYAEGTDGLPPADVISFVLASGDSVIVRPSGTEPKIKVYLFVKTGSREDSEKRIDELTEILDEFFRA